MLIDLITTLSCHIRTRYQNSIGIFIILEVSIIEEPTWKRTKEKRRKKKRKKMRGPISKVGGHWSGCQRMESNLQLRQQWMRRWIITHFTCCILLFKAHVHMLTSTSFCCGKWPESPRCKFCHCLAKWAIIRVLARLLPLHFPCARHEKKGPRVNTWGSYSHFYTVR